jgi:hypothetical protein
MHKTFSSISTICLCISTQLGSALGDSLHFTANNEVVLSKNQRKELKSSNSKINFILVDGVELKSSALNDGKKGIFFSGEQQNKPTLTHSMDITEPISVSLKICPTGGAYQKQTIMHLGSCELRYDMKNLHLEFVTYFNKSYQTIKIPCEMNHWSEVTFELNDRTSKLTVNEQSKELPFKRGSELKETQSIYLRFGMMGKGNRLYQGYLDDIEMNI